MFEHLDDANPPQPGSHERARVFSRADELVHHRRMLMGLGVAVVVALVAAVPGVLTAAGGSSKRVHTAASPATTPTTGEQTAGVVNPVTGEPIPGPSGPSATPTTTPQVLGNSFIRPQPTTRTNSAQGTTAPQPGRTSPAQPGGQSTFTSPTSTVACRNSYDQSCGPFRWDPPPAPDQPAQMTITANPAQPKAGEKVTFDVVITDPDDPNPTFNFHEWSYGDGPAMSTHGDPDPRVNTCPTRYGPWTPPDPGPGRTEENGGYFLEHTYGAPGTYTVKITEGATGCYDPYADDAVGTMTITVTP